MEQFVPETYWFRKGYDCKNFYSDRYKSVYMCKLVATEGLWILSRTLYCPRVIYKQLINGINNFLGVSDFYYSYITLLIPLQRGLLPKLDQPRLVVCVFFLLKYFTVLIVLFPFC